MLVEGGREGGRGVIRVKMKMRHEKEERKERKRKEILVGEKEKGEKNRIDRFSVCQIKMSTLTNIFFFCQLEVSAIFAIGGKQISVTKKIVANTNYFFFQSVYFFGV